MSLAYDLDQEDNQSMTKQRPTQETTNCFPAGQFSTAQFREAMGPGYQAALFREQPVLMGCQPTFTRPVPLPKPTMPRRPRVRLRLPFRVRRGFAHRLLGALAAG